MKTTRAELDRLADASGYRAEILEKVLWMLDLLQGIYEDSFLEERLALKGGTALNLFVLNLPRLSVDIDLNYIGSPDPAVAEKERPEIVDILGRLCRSKGLTPGPPPGSHAGGKWHLTYPGQVTPTGNLELDLNFLQRVPLWPTTIADSTTLGRHQAKKVRLMDIHDLAAGKLHALLSRTAARDLFDAAGLAGLKGLNLEKLRLAFVVYGATDREDWRKVTPGDITVDAKDIEHRLVPMLSGKTVPAVKDLRPWIADLSERAHRLVERLLPFTGEERAFLEGVIGAGTVDAGLLTKDSALASRILANPALLWKVKNVQSHNKDTRSRS